MASMPNLKLHAGADTRTPRDRLGLRGFTPNNAPSSSSSSSSSSRNNFRSRHFDKSPRHFLEDDGVEDDELDDDEDDVTSFIRPGLSHHVGAGGAAGNNAGFCGRLQGNVGRGPPGIGNGNGGAMSAGARDNNKPQTSFRKFGKPGNGARNGFGHQRRPVLELLDSAEPGNTRRQLQPHPTTTRPSTLNYCSKNGVCSATKHHSGACAGGIGPHNNNGGTQQQKPRITYDSLARFGASGPSSSCRRPTTSTTTGNNNNNNNNSNTFLGNNNSSNDDEDEDTLLFGAQFGPIYSRENLIKNLALLSVASTLISSGTFLLPSLNSALYDENSVAAYAPALLFGMATLSSLFGAPVCEKMRPKWGLVLAGGVVALGAAARAPRSAATCSAVVLVVAAVQGLVWGLALNAATQALLGLAGKLTCLERRCPERVQVKVAIVFHLCVGTFWLWGNGLSAGILSALDGYWEGRNATDKEMELGPPWTPVAGVAATLTLIGALAAAAMDDIRRAVVQDPLGRGAFRRHLLALRDAGNDLTTLLTVPLAFFVGLESAVLLADFNYNFVSCRMGMKYIGFVMMGYGFAFLVGSYVIGVLRRPARRLAFLWAATAFFAGVLLTARLMTSSKMADDPPLFYVLAGVWGLCSGVWDTLIKTFLHATNGQKTCSHVVHMTTELFGLTLGFVLYPALCMQAKLWILAALMIPAVVCQAWAEITFARQTDNDASVATL